MECNEYQKRARETAIYPDVGSNIYYPVLGLCGEAGEVAEKLKKVIRDKNGRISGKTKTAIINELGDVLWYVANTASELGADLNEIAENNLNKLASRKERDVIKGDGDNR